MKHKAHLNPLFDSFHQPQPCPLHAEHHHVLPNRQPHGSYGVDQTISTTWQAQTLGAPAMTVQHSALRASHPTLQAGHGRSNVRLAGNNKSFQASNSASSTV
ncbi:hypothetical protein B5807_11879 [Epicoccum nigrum]|uniref:Uncharacterized protein n=1 Tax=Epicoccum nigrum TaxID=105696 RepID=A0A1Y2LJ11_EPING|nr:hypothetical protein B5807_11879 [Epicoccum nigrum]